VLMAVVLCWAAEGLCRAGMAQEGGAGKDAKTATESTSTASAVVADGASATTSSALTGEKATTYPQDIARILNRGKLIVGLYCSDKPPFVMTNEDGSLHGLDIDIATMVAKEFGVALEYDRTSKSYTELVDNVRDGKVDMVICKLSRTLKRAMEIRFSDPYLIFCQTLCLNKKFMARNHIPVEFPVDALREKEFLIGVREKTSYVEYAKALFPKAKIVEGKWDELVGKLQQNQIDGLFRDEDTIRRLIQTRPDLAIDVSAYVLTDRKDPICIGIPPQSAQLQMWVNLLLDQKMPTRKTVADLIREYPIVNVD